MSVFESGVFMYRAVISNEFIKKHVQMFISIGSLPGRAYYRMLVVDWKIVL